MISKDFEKLKNHINGADAIIIGAGSGLSAAAGLMYSGKRFETLFPDFIERYHFTDMYSAAFHPHETLEEFWGYFSKHIYYNRYAQDINNTYENLLQLVRDKNYFVLTTNVDHLFQKTGFDKKKLFYTQGDYGLFQCSVPCHKQTYDNSQLVLDMITKQENLKIPTELIPYCPICGKPMTTNLRKDATFVEDDGWHSAAKKYESFIKENKNKRIVFLELGVGFNTPSIIKYPFWQMTYENKNAIYVCINSGDMVCAREIVPQSIMIDYDIHNALSELTKNS